MFSFKKFIEEKTIKPQDSDVKSLPGSQPKGYYKGVAKDKKDDRAKQFVKQTKMSDDNPAAYKKAPGDDKGKTKLSKHTKKVMKMYPSLYKDKNESVLYEDPSSSLKAKSEKSGISTGILRQVYNRGMAAWKTGHRPGAGQQQWAHARVNSFISKGSGTWGKADKDLAAKARSSKKSKKENYKIDYGSPKSIKIMKSITPGQSNSDMSVKEVLDTPAKRNAYKKASAKSQYSAAQRAAKSYPGTSKTYQDKQYDDNMKTRNKRVRGFKSVVSKSGTTGYEKEQANEKFDHRPHKDKLDAKPRPADAEKHHRFANLPIATPPRKLTPDERNKKLAKIGYKAYKEGTGGKPESFEAQYKRRLVKTTKPEHKEKGMNWRIKGKDRPEISIKLYKEKPGQAEFNKQLRRVAGHEFGG
tara:strand:- start:24774 stop:26012 length:1239 start_codon:yes stop_codon:yes gene_type:complete